MQYFTDSTGKIYAYDDSVNVTEKTDANGNPVAIPSGLTPCSPPNSTAEELLASAITSQIVLISNAYISAIETDISYTSVGGVTTDFQADAAAQQNLIRTLLAYTVTKQVPSGFYWVASNNTQVPFTFTDLQNLARDMTNRGWEAFTKLQELKSQITAATTITGVQAITW